jgi:regulator of Ty1 transposition protein 103
VQAARLGALLKTLANAEGAVAETLKARKTLVEGLEKLLAKNRADLGVEESQLRDINSRKVETEGKKREVEAGILRGLAQFSSTTGEGRATTPDHDPPRPDAEPLTPPPLGGTDVESITPIGTPRGFVSTTDANAIAEEPHNPNAELAAPVFEALPTGSVVLNGPSVLPGLSSREMSPLGGDVKRRKMSSVVVGREVGDEFAGFADEAGVAIDAEVEAMLG